MLRSAFLITAAPMALMIASPAHAVDETFETERGTIQVSTVVDGLANPWAIAFLPGDEGMLVTERAGALRLVDAEGNLSEPIEGVPQVDARGQGGLLDVALDPDFADNRLVYLSFAEAGDGGNSTAVARGQLNEDATALEEVEVIFSQQPKVQSTAHFGSRLVFDNDGHLFVTMGDRSSRQFRDMAQDTDSHIGTIARINPDGSVPQDNPFVGQDGALPEIWAYGVRNVQAAALHPETGVLWEIEHGPRGGDELNVIEPGANYGWPVASFGVEYSGDTIGEGISSAEGMVDPIYEWTPVIAPSGMAFYSGDAFPEWQGNLFVGGLASTALVRLELDGDSVTHEERLLEPLGLRIRDVAQGPDGAIYVATDEANGGILRVAPQTD
ncbi:PQQ-dependent sugar dehydrogenase [Mesorhizobium microcysteis]|uniref:PQQ-dependent sugar dehydrogenase n=1 Tax=Neoaquamicrobium microcysteis TaxID=2682781 RepID=A0A5D4GPD1_9HYPH|nr:PQQ-dependent sugar dehydrogenase [Mesorhizobium microcysteis]TYR29783.1 PQQ-dependent sugar dehydrogenase [Mesorhizobium microcysteis]